MEFKKDTLEPLYKLHIGKSGDSNALYISKKMGIPDLIIEKTKQYIEDKNYNYDLVKESKIVKERIDVRKENEYEYKYKVGDRVIFLEKNEAAIVYKEKDKLNNITLLYDGKFIEVNIKRIKLDVKADDLYPEGYDMNQLFVSFKDRKLEHDIERGSKKAIKKLLKQN